MNDLPPPRIHPSAVVHPGAQLAAGVEIGPFSVIDAHVVLGPSCIVGPHVHITGHTTLGGHNRIHSGAVLGDAPQDYKYGGADTPLRIGSHNIFREHVTVHRSSKLEEDTVIGDGNFLMAGCHVGHNCVVGSHNTLANGALLAGHVTIADQAFISGNCVIHQFCRVGRLAMMQGKAGSAKTCPRSASPAGTMESAGSTSSGCAARASHPPNVWSSEGSTTTCSAPGNAFGWLSRRRVSSFGIQRARS